MHRILFTLVLAALIAGPLAASEKTDAMAVVQRFVDSLNKNDLKAAVATCADETAIIDDFPPHAWRNCAEWAHDLDASVKKNDITDILVTLGTLQHLDVAGDHAYVVATSKLTYKIKGKSMQQTGSDYTFVLHKSDAGWRIAAWSWNAAKDVEIKASGS